MESGGNSQPFDLQQAVAMLQVLRQAGLLDRALEASTVNLNVEDPGNRPGSMHDGCKRRMTEACGSEGSVDDTSFSMVNFSPQQAPVPPASGYKATEPTKVKLPPGVESVSHWGKTVCTLPKLADKKLTYEKLVKEAETSQEIKEYLLYCHNHSKQSAKMKDLKDYMIAVNYMPEKSVGAYYPGSTSVREFEI